MQQMARNATLEEDGWSSERQVRYVVHDRDTKLSASFGETLAAAGVQSLRLPARSPNLNSYTERWVRTVRKSACGS
jgi:putative transposase